MTDRSLQWTWGLDDWDCRPLWCWMRANPFSMIFALRLNGTRMVDWWRATRLVNTVPRSYSLYASTLPSFRPMAAITMISPIDHFITVTLLGLARACDLIQSLCGKHWQFFRSFCMLGSDHVADWCMLYINWCLGWSSNFLFQKADQCWPNF
jgi:hypothetical protein